MAFCFWACSQELEHAQIPPNGVEVEERMLLTCRSIVCQHLSPSRRMALRKPTLLLLYIF